jgi:acyl-CoA reductase-like NAD-dependent aldehyde dehydrogenase
MSIATLQPTLAKPKPGKLFIGGEFVDAASGKTFPTINPATGQVIVQIAEADAPDVDRAVDAARKAFESKEWSQLTPSKRGRLLWKLGELIMKNLQEFAELETLDTGKPIGESSKLDIPEAADCFFYYAGWATKINGETVPISRGGNCFAYTLREPIGVCGQIIPWNFPLQMLAWKVAPALACGNTVIVKPAEQTPLTALRFAELCAEAGVPAGVVNILPGYGHTAGAALVNHPGVDKIAFTGSTEVGQIIMRSAADTLKKVSLELGGKSPNIIFADADVETAAKVALMGIFWNQGEMCTAGSRILVEDSVHDAFMDTLVGRAQKSMPGDPLDPKTRLGALISEEHINRVMKYVDAGKTSGAKLLAGGERITDGGYFMKPTVFDDVDNTMKIAQEEIFGPVASVIRFKTLEEAAQIANSTKYGLAAGIWTRDVKKAHAFAKTVKAGTVWVNTYSPQDNALPFGGYKMSGIGRELGGSAIDLYTQTKSVWIDLN